MDAGTEVRPGGMLGQGEMLVPRWCEVTNARPDDVTEHAAMKLVLYGVRNDSPVNRVLADLIYQFDGEVIAPRSNRGGNATMKKGYVYIDPPQGRLTPAEAQAWLITMWRLG